MKLTTTLKDFKNNIIGYFSNNKENGEDLLKNLGFNYKFIIAKFADKDDSQVIEFTNDIMEAISRSSVSNSLQLSKNYFEVIRDENAGGGVRYSIEKISDIPMQYDVLTVLYVSNTSRKFFYNGNGPKIFTALSVFGYTKYYSYFIYKDELYCVQFMTDGSDKVYSPEFVNWVNSNFNS